MSTSIEDSPSRRLQEVSETVYQQETSRGSPATVLEDVVPPKYGEEQLQVDHVSAIVGTKAGRQSGITGSDEDLHGKDARLSPSFLGEVSDLRFFNLVKSFLQAQDDPGALHKAFDRYDQDESKMSDTSFQGVYLPSPEDAKPYTDAYFSTIHVAYPFIPESLFMEEYSRIYTGDKQKNESNNTQTALTCK